MAAADPLDLRFLDRAEQLGLDVRLQLADLVEEQRAAVGQFELPELLAHGPGERPLFVPEQRRLDELRGDGRQVHGHERAVGAPGLAVDHPREQLLAGSALAQDEHRGVQRRHLAHEVEDVAHAPAGPRHEGPLAIVGHLGAERHHLPVQVGAIGGVADERHDGVVLEVLGDVVVGAELHRADGRFDLVDGRDHDDFDQALRLLDVAEHLEAADARHPDVEQHHVHVLAVENGQPGLARRRAQHAVLAPQDRRQRVAHALVIVDDEDCLGARSHRSRPFRMRPRNPADCRRRAAPAARSSERSSHGARPRRSWPSGRSAEAGARC